MQLRVLDPTKRGSDAELRELHGAAGIAADEPFLAEWEPSAPLYLTLAAGSDCVVLVKPVQGARRGMS